MAKSSRSAGRTTRLLPLSLIIVAAVSSACSSGGTNAQSTPPSSPPTTTVSSPANSPSSPSTTSQTDLSGHWKGQYSGAYSGTFSLTWQQNGSKLTGTITLSSTPAPQDLTGTVSGDKITFGTVGSTAVQYSGTVSGNTMSGKYEVAGQKGGNWTASRA